MPDAAGILNSFIISKRPIRVERLTQDYYKRSDFLSLEEKPVGARQLMRTVDYVEMFGREI
jgi:hypothetical protein